VVYNQTMQPDPIYRDTWRTILREQGRSLAWLAHRTGTPDQTVYAYSMGRRRPTRPWLEKVAVALDVPVALLLDGHGDA